MPSQKSIPISELITTANSELLRLDFKRSALQIYCAEFRKFSDYYSNEKIQDYTATTGRSIPCAPQAIAGRGMEHSSWSYALMESPVACERQKAGAANSIWSSRRTAKPMRAS